MIRRFVASPRQRNCLALGVFGFAALAFGFGALVWISYCAALDDARRTSEKLALALELHCEAVFGGIEAALNSVAEELAADGLANPGQAGRIDAVIQRNSKNHHLRGIVLVDAAGYLTHDSRSTPPIPIFVGDRDSFIEQRDHLDLGLFVGAPIQSRISGDWILPVSRRLVTADGDFAGVVQATIPLSDFGEFFRSLQVGPGSRATLLRADGVLLAREPQELVGRSYAQNPQFDAIIRASLVGSARQRWGTDNVDRIGSWRTILTFGLIAIVAIATDDALAGWHQSVLVYVTIWLLSAALLVALLGLAIHTAAREEAAERAARHKENQLTAILDNAPLAIFLKDSDGRFQLINQRHTEWFGYRLEEVHGRTSAEFEATTIAEETVRSDLEVLTLGKAVSFERMVATGVGIDHTQTIKFPVRDEQGHITGLAGFVVDISERKRAEENLRWSEERLRALIENSNDIIVVIQPDGSISYRGPTASEGLGYPSNQIIGRQLLDLVHPEDAVIVEDTLRSIAAKPGLYAAGHSRLRHDDGSWRHIAWSARNATHIPGVEGIVVTCHDITEARLLEEQLQQAQKMESIGRLAGGIAHDFNNILGAMLGFARFLVQDLTNGTPEHALAQRIVMAGERAQDITTQILTFSRHGVVERKATDLVAIVSDMREMLAASLPPTVQLLMAVPEESLIAEVNSTQICRILLNLCHNAKDAISGSAGHISIALSRLRAGDSDYSLFRDGSPRGDAIDSEHWVTAGTLEGMKTYARLSVTDDGVGIATDVLRRVFDPFFTTKEPGRGTGLGLSVVHGIITACQGACAVFSRIGEGAAFNVYLPLSPLTIRQRCMPGLLERASIRI